MTKIFDPKKWLQESVPDEETTIARKELPTTIYEEVDEVIKRLEEKRMDITSAYKDWIDIGFALSEEFGENGREFFHRVSRMYSKYDEKETDSQYSSCLK